MSQRPSSHEFSPVAMEWDPAGHGEQTASDDLVAPAQPQRTHDKFKLRLAPAWFCQWYTVAAGTGLVAACALSCAVRKHRACSFAKVGWTAKAAIPRLPYDPGRQGVPVQEEAAEAPAARN